MKIAVTGHRPNKLWGYNYNHPKYIKLSELLTQELINLKATHIISGMALGVDTVFALAGLQLKQSNPNLIIECAIPCLGHSSQWLKESVDLYNKILKLADKVTYVSELPYHPILMQKRNEYMVNNCNALIAVWNGTQSGTANCIRYAQTTHKKIIYINPTNI